MNKNIIISILIVLGVLVAGYFLINKDMTKNEVEEPTNGEVSGKIDINAVCEGALAYMTFSDGASAEAFVQECKEGKHPEVIEQWKAQMNIDSDVAI